MNGLILAARRRGLRPVYTGNVHDVEGDTTYCPSCGAACIERDWYQILAYRLDEARAERFGARRIPVVIA